MTNAKKQNMRPLDLSVSIRFISVIRVPIYKLIMNSSNRLNLLRKILTYLQIPVYILALKFVLSFFLKVEGVSENIDSFFDSFLWVFVISFMASGIIAVLIIVLAYAKKNILLYAVLSIIALAVLFTYLFKFAGHLMFISIPFIVVLYHAVIFTVNSRTDAPKDVKSA